MFDYYPGNGSPLFEAKWAGKCYECGERWDKGDQIGYLEGESKPVCEECHDKYNTFVPYDPDDYSYDY